MSVKAPFRKASLSLMPRVELSDTPPSSRRPASLGLPGRPGVSATLPRTSGRAPRTQAPERSEGKVIIDYVEPVLPVTAVRSTLITSSLMSLRERGLFERYDALQTSPHRNTIMNLVAGEWLPVEVVQAHYEACDALGLSVDEQIAIGKDVSRRIHETFLSLIVKAARGVGMTPWVLLPKGRAMQSRLCKGGGIRILELGPKSARIELARLPHLAIPYVRHGLLGLYTAAIELLASNVNARIVKTESTEPTRLFVLRIDWD